MILKTYRNFKLFSLIVLSFALYSFADKVKMKDELQALWTFYKYQYIKSGRVISFDEGGVTTSEGQSYAMLRAVWAEDRSMFDTVWNWTRKNLRGRDDKLFCWKYNNGVIQDYNAATDADVDIALSLLLASRQFKVKRYADDARRIIRDIWEHEVVKAGENYYLTAGNWAVAQRYPTIHTAYLAPYAYATFADVDPLHPWKELVKSSYEILHWIYDKQELTLPPELLYVDKKTGTLLLKRPGIKDVPRFSYDAFPIFWRVAVDYRWFGRDESKLRKKMLAFFQDEWAARGLLYDTYECDGNALSEYEGLPLYATVQALATVVDEPFAKKIREEKLDPLWKKAMDGKDTPYYFHNWIWFGRAFELKSVKSFTEFMDFLSPVEFNDVSGHFPWVLFLVTVLLYILSRIETFKYSQMAKKVFLVAGFVVCGRYLIWRLLSTLNFMEPLGPVISITLYVAEVYCFTTVIFLFVQTGFDSRTKRKPVSAPNYQPTVDIFIPIYSEAPEILERTLLAARNMNYVNKRIHVCDDSHKQEVVELAARLGVNYIKGPKKHAKAGNINNAISKTSGDLLLIFDTDHIPVKTFLDETVPYFSDEKVGMLQTPHHFYNPDLFQRAFSAEHRVPNEADQFNHGVQGGRDNWGGSFFVGSGAVFRRSAIEQIGGIQLLSITEDIHTSQHLHARGWKSVFVNKDLLGGLTAENLSSYIVQRRRWMLGCLQIFLKDNPLKMKGLPFRHKIGYFASLSYFFYPLPKVIFWSTPLYYLLFHLHPLFSDVTILMSYLIPYMVVLPMINSSLLPRWPRMLWGQAYENVICFQMFRSMFDLFLPKNLGFKVTPKGIKSAKRTFDASSVKLLLVAVGISVFAIGKGIFEFNYFGIEQDAYFFNMGWAIYNLFIFGSALLVAWERPQRRDSDRVEKKVACRITGEEGIFRADTVDMSVNGASFLLDKKQQFPKYAVIELGPQLRIGAVMIYNEAVNRSQSRCGYRFEGIDKALEEKIFLMIFSDPETWAHCHDNRPSRSLVVAYHYITGIYRAFLPQKQSRRMEHREKLFSRGTVKVNDSVHNAMFLDKSISGFSIALLFKGKPEFNEVIIISGHEEIAMQTVYIKSLFNNKNIWRLGLIAKSKIPNSVKDDSVAATMITNNSL